MCFKCFLVFPGFILEGFHYAHVVESVGQTKSATENVHKTDLAQTLSTLTKTIVSITEILLQEKICVNDVIYSWLSENK